MQSLNLLLQPKIIKTSIALMCFIVGCWQNKAFGQYSFEKYPKVKYKQFFNWIEVDTSRTSDTIHHTITIPSFYQQADLKIKLTSFSYNWDSSFVSIYKNNKLIYKQFEPMGFSPSNVYAPVRVADINGDGLTDLKLVIPYNGNGTASLNARVIFLFQTRKKSFHKVSFLDKIAENIVERDFNNDKNYEIITLTLTGYQDHSYWVFNLFNYQNSTLVNVNEKFNYPIMVQYLYRDNYKITDKISRKTMRQFSVKHPEELFTK